MSFKTGDLVVLKSGGPVMTVNAVYTDGLHAVWFSGKKMEAGTFATETVKAAPSQSDED